MIRSAKTAITQLAILIGLLALGISQLAVTFVVFGNFSEIGQWIGALAVLVYFSAGAVVFGEITEPFRRLLLLYLGAWLISLAFGFALSLVLPWVAPLVSGAFFLFYGSHLIQNARWKREEIQDRVLSGQTEDSYDYVKAELDNRTTTDSSPSQSPSPVPQQVPRSIFEED